MPSKADLQATAAAIAANAATLSAQVAALPDDAVPPPPPPPVDIYASGTKYPARPTASIVAAQVLPGAKQVHALVQLSHASPMTVVGSVRCLNGTGGSAHPDTTKRYIFRTGDPLEQTITFDIANMVEGNTVKLIQPDVPDGAVRGGDALITAAASAVPQQPISFAGRAPLAFSPVGDLVYQATGKEILESGLWMNQYAHGRTQPDNGETGYYMPDAFEVVGDDLLLKAYRLGTPYADGSPPTMYSFASSVLTGLMQVPGEKFLKVRPELSFKYGTIEWVARMPNRVGTWPGLWLCSVKNGFPQWPFEIDVHEGLIGRKASNGLSSTIHGGVEGSNAQKFAAGAIRTLMSDFGLKSTLDTEPHAFACVVDPEWITIYVDGVETIRFANAFNSTQGFYPLMDNAVKIGSSAAYTDGDGNLAVSRVCIWRAA